MTANINVKYTVTLEPMIYDTCNDSWNIDSTHDIVFIETESIEEARAEFDRLASEPRETFITEAASRGGARFMKRTGYALVVNEDMYEVEDGEGDMFQSCALDAVEYTYDDYKAEEE